MSLRKINKIESFNPSSETLSWKIELSVIICLKPGAVETLTIVVIQISMYKEINNCTFLNFSSSCFFTSSLAPEWRSGKKRNPVECRIIDGFNGAGEWSTLSLGQRGCRSVSSNFGVYVKKLGPIVIISVYLRVKNLISNLDNLSSTIWLIFITLRIYDNLHLTRHGWRLSPSPT